MVPVVHPPKGNHIIEAPLPNLELWTNWEVPEGCTLMTQVHVVRRGKPYPILKVRALSKFFGVGEGEKLFCLNQEAVKRTLKRIAKARDWTQEKACTVRVPFPLYKAGQELGNGSFAEGVRQALEQYVERTKRNG